MADSFHCWILPSFYPGDYVCANVCMSVSLWESIKHFAQVLMNSYWPEIDFVLTLNSFITSVWVLFLQIHLVSYLQWCCNQLFNLHYIMTVSNVRHKLESKCFLGRLHTSQNFKSQFIVQCFVVNFHDHTLLPSAC